MMRSSWIPLHLILICILVSSYFTPVTPSDEYLHLLSSFVTLHTLVLAVRRDQLWYHRKKVFFVWNTRTPIFIVHSTLILPVYHISVCLCQSVCPYFVPLVSLWTWSYLSFIISFFDIICLELLARMAYTHVCLHTSVSQQIYMMSFYRVSSLPNLLEFPSHSLSIFLGNWFVCLYTTICFHLVSPPIIFSSWSYSNN